MCTYNGEKWVRQQLNSLLQQTLPPAELVVCDDGSSDCTLDIIRQFSLDAPFNVRFYQNQVNLNYAVNFLNGIKLTSHRYVAFCDQDDIWYPDKIALSYSVLKQTGSLLVTHGFDFIDSQGSKLYSTLDYTGSCLPTGYRLGPVNCAGFTFLLDKLLLEAAPVALDVDTYKRVCHSPESSGIGHDRLLCILASSLNAGVFIAKPLAGHRLHESNASGPKLRSNRLKSACSIFRSFFSRSSRQAISNLYSSIAEGLDSQIAILHILSDDLKQCDVENYIKNLKSVLQRRRIDNMHRALLYATPSSGLPGYCQLLRFGAYRRGDGGLGYAAALRDGLACLISYLIL